MLHVFFAKHITMTWYTYLSTPPLVMWFNTLGKKMMFYTVSVAFLILAASATTFVVLEQRKITDYHYANGKTFAEFVTPSIYEDYVSSPTSGQLSFLERINSRLAKHPDIISVVMVSRTGKIFFDTDDAKKGIAVGRNETTDRYVTDKTTLQMIAVDGITHRETVLSDGTEATEIVIPVEESSGAHIFSMRYLLSAASLNEQFEVIYRNVVLIAIPVFLLIIGISVLFSRSIVEPLRTLTRATEDVKKGNLDVTIVPSSKDEIGLLSQAFGLMVGELKRSREESLSYSRTIEKKVEERTRELNDKVEELGRVNRLMVDREIKMVELKKEITDLKQKVGG
jgi:methyl-accepting chemotaxis protein